MSAWKADALPLGDARFVRTDFTSKPVERSSLKPTHHSTLHESYLKTLRLWEISTSRQFQPCGDNQCPTSMIKYLISNYQSPPSKEHAMAKKGKSKKKDKKGKKGKKKNKK